MSNPLLSLCRKEGTEKSAIDPEFRLRRGIAYQVLQFIKEI